MMFKIYANRTNLEKIFPRTENSIKNSFEFIQTDFEYILIKSDELDLKVPSDRLDIELKEHGVVF